MRVGDRAQVWLCAIPGVEPQAKNEQMERSSYYVFDTGAWEAVRKDNFVLHYDAIERAPQLPRATQQPPAPPPPPQAPQQAQQQQPQQPGMPMQPQ
jgi:CCR4-NOT transcription complex subunit 2